MWIPAPSRARLALMATKGTKGSRLKYRTGAVRDRPDHRDHIRKYGDDDIPSTDDHPVVDLREYVGHVFDQGRLGSCGASSVCAAFEFLLQKVARELNHIYYDFDASRLFAFYNGRKLTSTTDEDVGVCLRDALKALSRWGVCREDLWPYQEDKLTNEPPPACYVDGDRHKITKYEHLEQEKHQLRACLKEGFPFAFVCHLYESFDRIGEDGLMPLPSYEELDGGPLELHALLCVGYNDNTECFTILNSWGEDFGDQGYFYMPYRYMMDYEESFDLWKISEVAERGLNTT